MFRPTAEADKLKSVTTALRTTAKCQPRGRSPDFRPGEKRADKVRENHIQGLAQRQGGIRRQDGMARFSLLAGAKIPSCSSGRLEKAWCVTHDIGRRARANTKRRAHKAELAGARLGGRKPIAFQNQLSMKNGGRAAMTTWIDSYLRAEAAKFKRR